MRGNSCRLSFVVFLPALVCYGQQIFLQPTPQPQNQTPQPQNQAPRRTVTGTVSNGSSGEPIRHVLVQIWGPHPASVLTGSDGRFEIDDVPEGPIVFALTKPGFFDPRNSAKHSDPGFTVGSGNNDFQLTLLPAGRLVGRVTDQDGEAVEQAQLQILSEQIIQGRKQWQPQNSSNTDDDGSYRIDELVPGHYILTAQRSELPGSGSSSQQEVTAPAYYPDARELASAQAIEIGPGQEFRADFHLHTERGFRITGHISGIPAGVGVALSIQTSTGQHVFLPGVNVDQSRGEFVVPAVPSGTWTLRFGVAGRDGRSYEARQEVAVTANISDLRIALHPGASIPLTINRAANPVTTNRVSNMPESMLEPAGPGINASLLSADPLAPRSYRMESRGAPAALMFNNVAEGKYKLILESFASVCVESARYGDVDLLRDYLIVGPDTGTQPLTINLGEDCATLTAKVTPGETHAPVAFLVVVPNSPFAEPIIRPVGIESSLPIQAAAFLAAPLVLSPGTYQVFAFSNPQGLEYANPEVLREYPSQSITLDPGQKAEITIEVSEVKE